MRKLVFVAVVSWSHALWAAEPVGGRDLEGAAGLRADLERIVAAEEPNWFVDDKEYDDMYPAVLESVCRASPAARQTALTHLKGELAGIGDAEQLYRREGEWTDQAERALNRERQVGALERGIEGAKKDCPFWVSPRTGFAGLQTGRDRWSLNVETGGVVQLRRTAGTWTIGGGGNGRVLPGYGFGDHVTVMAGAEFGGGAMIRPGPDPSQFIINYFPAVPVVVRFQNVDWHYELEGAAVALFQADDTNLSYGIRGGAAIGISALRTRGIVPWAGLGAAYEHYLPTGGRPRAHFVRAGLRVGLRLDL